MKNIDVRIFSLRDLEMREVVNIFEPFELEILLWTEPHTSDIDIMLENMLYYFIEKEFYEYACVVRDEINRRI
jgi:hypothetical protein